MEHSYRLISVEQRGEVACVHLRREWMDEMEIHDMANEMMHLATEGGCPRLALSLGPETPRCLYSVFLAKLVTIQRMLREKGGGLKLCQCNPHTLGVFEASKLSELFEFAPDLATAVQDWNAAQTE